MKVTAQAPTRISLFGGGTDLPVYYQKFGGLVISLSINIRQSVTLSDESDKYEYLPNANPQFYEAFFKEFDFHPKGMVTKFDERIESGLGSSASAAVCMVGALNKYLHCYMGAREIAEKAWDIEVNKLGLYGGKQDQYAAVWGGFNIIWFNPTDGIFRNEVFGSKSNYILKHLLLFDTGETRKSPKIQEKLKKPDSCQMEALHQIKKCANMARKAIEIGEIQQLGKYLDDSWQFKKKSNPLMTNEKIDRIYNEAKLSGAIGGKLMGSGGGGFMFFFVDPRCKERVVERLEDLGCRNIDFSLDRNGLEIKIL